MLSAFSKEKQKVPEVKRNAFDLSHQNNLTMQMGYLYPCLCQEVIPGDTFEIDTAFGIRMMPLLFPIQTKVRVDLHFFYVRNRYLWEDWQNFITSADSSLYNFPTLTPPSDMPIGTGSLCDYLGLPTRQFSGLSSTKGLNLSREVPPLDIEIYANTEAFNLNRPLFGYLDRSSVLTSVNDLYSIPFNSDSYSDFELKLNPNEAFEVHVDDVLTKATNQPVFASLTDDHYISINGLSAYFAQLQSGSATFTFKNISGKPLTLNLKQLRLVMCYKNGQGFQPFDRNQQNVTTITYTTYQESEASIADLSKKVPISSLPFRAYECIYNSFYRDQRNNPLTSLEDGTPIPNTYITNKGGGADSTNYHLYRRNWEQDCFTTALPTPQQGPAPIVGVSALGTASVMSSDGKVYKVKLHTGNDGDTIVNFEDNSELPQDVRESLVAASTQGFTINDFRSVNSLQRWLETNFRHGIKYRDQIRSHFGVDIKFDELDMPEFLGGVSQFINIDQINQTTETSTSPLGAFAGQGSAIGNQKHTIKRYFDEHGFVMGIISISPTPVYSQQLPKLFTKTGNLDYFFPEFGHIGFQPVPLREICPFQLQDSQLKNVLGYQRPWYDYLQALDSAHGLFRTDFKDFLLQRVFLSPPSLNPDFLTVDESQLNDVFAVDAASNADRFLGQVHFKITAQRPIPRYGVPKLE